jgi:hypothetical protein
VQRRGAAAVARVQVEAPVVRLQQCQQRHAGAGGAAPLRSVVRACVAARPLLICLALLPCIALLLLQLGQDVEQRAAAVGGNAVGLRAGLQQQPGDREVAAPARLVERGLAWPPAAAAFDLNTARPVYLP